MEIFVNKNTGPGTKLKIYTGQWWQIQDCKLKYHADGP